MSAPRNQNIYAACGFIYFYRLSAHKFTRTKGTHQLRHGCARRAAAPRWALPAGSKRAQLRKAAGRGPFGFAFHFPRPGRRRSSQSIEPHLYYPLAAPGLLQRGDAMTTSARTGAAGVPPSERRRNADGGLTETAAPAERGVPGARIAESARPEPETRCSGSGSG